MPDSPPQLAHLEPLGDATKFASQMHALIPRCALLENFSPAEVLLLAHFMEMYRAEPGVEIIQEGDGGDFMLMVVEGKVEVQKRDRWNTPQTLAVVEGGRTLGEMSMIDGEARFATRSEEHTPELQSQSNIVCRLLLEKKNGQRLRESTAPLRHERV